MRQRLWGVFKKLLFPMGQQHLTVSGHFQEVQRVCRFVTDGARQAGFSEDALFQIELACDEAMTNIIEHAYGGEGKGDIKTSYQFKNGKFIIVLQDNGRSFNPDNVPAPPLPNEQPVDLETLKLGGLGLHFMNATMDEVQFTTHPKRGNKLTMIKYLSGG